MEQRKALTPIIAVVLLLMMTVAAAGLAYQFVIGTQSDVQDKVKGQLDSNFGAADLKFDVEQGVDVTAGTTLGNLNITIRNTGKSAIASNTITVYVDGVVQTPTGPLSPVIAGATATFNTGTTFPAIGSSKTLRLVHSSGTSVVYTCTNNGGTAQDSC